MAIVVLLPSNRAELVDGRISRYGSGGARSRSVTQTTEHHANLRYPGARRVVCYTASAIHRLDEAARAAVASKYGDATCLNALVWLTDREICNAARAAGLAVM